MRRRSTLLVLVLLAACAEERAPEGRGLTSRGRPVEHAQAAPAGAPADPFARSASPAEPTRSRRERVRAASPYAMGDVRDATPSPAEPLAPAPTPTGEARDYAAELRSALGNPASCFSAASNLPDRVSTSIRVVVGPSGRVTRAEVSAVGLPEGDLECLRDRAYAVRLRPVDDAPRTVSATLDVERRPPQAQAEAEAPPGQTP